MFVSNLPPYVPRLFLVLGTFYRQQVGQQLHEIQYYHSMGADVASNRSLLAVGPTVCSVCLLLRRQRLGHH